MNRLVLLLVVNVLPVLSQKVPEPYGWACYRMAGKRKWPGCEQATKIEQRNCLCSLPEFVSWTEHCLSQAVVNATDPAAASDQARKISLCPARTDLDVEGLKINELVPLVGDLEIATAVSTAQWRIVNDERAITAGIMLMSFWGLCVVAKILTSFLVHGLPRSWTTAFMLTLPVRWLRARIITAPAGPDYQKSQWSRSLSMRLPERLVVTMVASFAVLNYTLIFGLPFPYVDLNFIYPTVTQQRNKGISIRCAYMVMWKLPVVFFFAMTSHGVSWSLRVRKFFHKWIARITFLDIVIHGTAISLVKAEQHLYGYVWSVKYWIWGVTGIIAAGMIMLQTLRWAINCSYDTFKILHTILGVAFVLATWRHVQELPYGMHHTYAIVSIWSLDYLCRFSNTLWNGKVTAYLYHHSKDIMTLTIRQPSKHSLLQLCTNQKSGYLHLPPWYLFWQSHPFSLIRELPSADNEKPNNTTAANLPGDMAIVVDSSKSGDISFSSEDKPSQSNKTQSIDSLAYLDSQEGDLVIGIRAKDGITRKLAAMNDGPITVAVNGPYESFFPLHRFQQVLCFAGGVGITAIIGNLQYLVKTTGGLPNSDVKIYWTVRRPDEFNWAIRAIEKLPIPVKLEIYYAKEANDTEEGTSSLSETPEILNGSENTTHINCRMEIIWIVRNSVNLINADSLPPRMSTAIMACGPASFNLDARKAACWAIENAGAFVDYFEEQFGW